MPGTRAGAAATCVVYGGQRESPNTTLTMVARCVVFAALLAVASAHLASSWPERPLSKDVTLEQHYTEHHAHMRALAETSSEKPPTEDELAMWNIIACSSVGFVIVFYFSIHSMFTMEYTNDSLLYAKSKTD